MKSVYFLVSADGCTDPNIMLRFFLCYCIEVAYGKWPPLLIQTSILRVHLSEMYHWSAPAWYGSVTPEGYNWKVMGRLHIKRGRSPRLAPIWRRTEEPVFLLTGVLANPGRSWSAMTRLMNIASNSVINKRSTNVFQLSEVNSLIEWFNTLNLIITTYLQASAVFCVTLYNFRQNILKYLFLPLVATCLFNVKSVFFQ